MAKSHPEQFDESGVSCPTLRARNTMASFTLLACLGLLGIILHNQYGVRFFDAVMHGLGAIDQAQRVARAEPVVAAINAAAGKYRALGENLARRYRVSPEVTTDIVAKAHAIGEELKLDPLLILAVISVESRFNPIAQSTMGAKGLMQVIPRHHTEKFAPFGGEKVALDPHANIMVGASILKEYVRRTGNIGNALQMYVGATSEENENGYSAKVMAERDRLNFILNKYQNQNRAVRQPPRAGAPIAAI